MTRVNFTFHLGLEVGLVIVNCPTRQYLLLLIGSLHRFPYPDDKEIYYSYLLFIALHFARVYSQIKCGKSLRV